MDLLAKYNRQVPRYTSYPTSPHFTVTDNDKQYRKMLAQMHPDTKLSLYFHIPFCAKMCNFCGCYTKIVNRYEPIEEYIKLLLKEIELLASVLPSKFSITHLHWGGGSPTMLKPDDFARIIETINSNFNILDNASIDIELDPRTTNNEYIKGLAKAGINRASIGVQDYDKKVQTIINRIQPFDITKKAVDLLRQNNINNINMDLLYGLPYQNLDLIADMVEKTMSLSPDRIALFGYAHVPWMQKHQRLIPDESLPNIEQRYKQYLTASDMIANSGFNKIGLDHFAKPDDTLSLALSNHSLRRNFQGYSTDDSNSLLGLGISSIGNNDFGYFANCKPNLQYHEKITAGVLPIQRIHQLSSDDKLRHKIIEELMCYLTVDLNKICKTHNKTTDFFSNEIKKLDELITDGLCSYNNGIITIPENRRVFMRIVASVFDKYLKPPSKNSTPKHAISI